MRLIILFSAATLSASVVAYAVSPRQAILDDYAKEAGGATFSVERGKAFFEATHTGGKPDTPSCTTCHLPHQFAQRRLALPDPWSTTGRS